MINISIDLTKLDKSKIIEGKNGAKYINITVDALKEKDQYGKTHTVYLSQTKEEREAKEKKVYVGNGREFVFGANVETAPAPAPAPVPTGGKEINNLPF